nr:copia protein [Tanacetum cinerariifolium]
DSLIALTAFADADHAGCQDTRRSTSGSLQFPRDRLISWSSKRQKSAAISYTEAEYITLYHYIKEHVENRVIELYFVNTEYQLADLFTKALGRERIEFLINKLGMRSFTPETLKQLTADVSEIYMQEFWATAAVHHHSIRFKMDNKKRIVNLEYFREMLHMYLRIPGKTFDELPFEEEILAFLRFLRQSGEIRKLTDVNINKLHQTRRSFVAVINKCLNFVYQVEHKDAKKRNEMYYPRFTKVIIHYFMTKDPSIPKRNKVNWHYVRDDQMFIMIKLVSRHQNTQQFGVMLPVELTNKDIRNSEAYKEYYAIALGATKESVRKTKSSSDTTITPPTTAGTRLSTLAKGKQHAKSSKEKGLTVLSEVAITKAEQMKLAMKRSLQQTHISQASGSGNDDASLGLNVGGEEGQDTEDDDEELYRDVKINLEGRDVEMTDVHTTQE